MNTIKFSKISNKTTEQHNLELINIREQSIFGNKLNLYTPCNLNIFVTEACQNSCYFCINNKTNGGRKICDISDEEYMRGLLSLFNELECSDYEVTITGGEPTLNLYRFVETMKLCRKYKLKCRTVSTTGLNLMVPYNGKPLCEHMIENEFVHNINISRMHFNENKNAEIFKGKNISNKDVERLALFFKLNNAEMRISCNLIEGYIDSFDKMMEFVSFYDSIGVDTVMFRELEGCDGISLPETVKEGTKEFNYLETLHGIVYDVDIFTYQDFLVKHYKTIPSKKKDIVYSLSYKNGHIRNGFTGDKINIKLI